MRAAACALPPENHSSRIDHASKSDSLLTVRTQCGAVLPVPILSLRWEVVNFNAGARVKLFRSKGAVLYDVPAFLEELCSACYCLRRLDAAFLLPILQGLFVLLVTFQ